MAIGFDFDSKIERTVSYLMRDVCLVPRGF